MVTCCEDVHSQKSAESKGNKGVMCETYAKEFSNWRPVSLGAPKVDDTDLWRRNQTKNKSEEALIHEKTNCKKR